MRDAVEPFPVYRGSCHRLGELPPKVIEEVIRFYVVALSHIAYLQERKDTYLRLPEEVAQEVNKQCNGMTSLVFVTCGLLAFYAEVPFEMPTVAVAAPQAVDEKTNSDLNSGLSRLKKELSWTDKIRRSFHKN